MPAELAGWQVQGGMFTDGTRRLLASALAGGLAWSYGEAPTLLMLIYVMHRWFRNDTAQAVAADRRADAHGDPELDAYNDYLTRLHQKDT